MVCDINGTVIMWPPMLFVMWILSWIINEFMPLSENDLVRFLLSMVEMLLFIPFILLWFVFMSLFSPGADLFVLCLINSTLTYVIFHMSLYQLVKYVKMRMWNNVKSHFVYLSYENRNHWI